jgi:hypothetical protein
MGLKEDVSKIEEWGNTRTEGVQEWDIEFFRKTVLNIETSRILRSEKIAFLRRLHRYFNTRKDVIKEYLIEHNDSLKKTTGEGAVWWANFIYKSLFGKPWPMELAKWERETESEEEKITIIATEKATQDNIITAIKTFVFADLKKGEKSVVMKALEKVYNETEKNMGKGFIEGELLALNLKGSIVAEVQAILGRINSRKLLENLLEKKELIEQALEYVWKQQINRAITETNKAKNLSIGRINPRSYYRFVDPILELIEAEIEAKIKMATAV